VLLVGIAFTGYGLVQTRQHLGTTQSELETARLDAAQVKAKAAELGGSFASLQSELEKANSERNGLQTELKTAKRDAEQAKSKFAKLFASVTSDRDKARAQESELETARQDAEQAKAQAANFASLLANLNPERPQQSPDAFKLTEQPPTIYTGTPDTPALVTAQIKAGNILLARGDFAEALESRV
jgi:chromosome segregation ATPase